MRTLLALLAGTVILVIALAYVAPAIREVTRALTEATR